MIHLANKMSGVTAARGMRAFDHRVGEGFNNVGEVACQVSLGETVLHQERKEVDAVSAYGEEAALGGWRLVWIGFSGPKGRQTVF